MNEQDRLQRLGRENVCEGVRYEPRIFWDALDFASGDREAFSNPDIFRNGEGYAVRITHLTAVMRGFQAASSPPNSPLQGDERLVQNYSMRVRAHDTYYMTERFLPLPLWHNQRVAGADAVSRGSSSWPFLKQPAKPALAEGYLPQPFTLGQRDVFEVGVQLETVPSGAREVAVAFDGVGRLSRRPYRLAATLDVSDAIRNTLPVDSFRNEGAEPIDIYSMSIRCSSPLADADPSGDIADRQRHQRSLGCRSHCARAARPDPRGPPGPGYGSRHRAQAPAERLAVAARPGARFRADQPRHHPHQHGGRLPGGRRLRDHHLRAP
jgi:hypothetical protein